MRLGRRQIAVLRAAAEGTASMWHSGQGRMTVSTGAAIRGDDDGLFPDSVLDTLFKRDLIFTEEHERFGTHFHIRLSDAGREVLAALDA